MKLTKRILHLVAKPVRFEYPMQNQILARQLLEFMIENDGIGLAAPQVGIGLRMFVMKIGLRSYICCNPEIISSSGNLSEFAEGCLSFPGKGCIISRPDTVLVRYQQVDGTVAEEELSGLAARCYQHELDHLDGVTMFDRQEREYAE